MGSNTPQYQLRHDVTFFQISPKSHCFHHSARIYISILYEGISTTLFVHI